MSGARGNGIGAYYSTQLAHRATSAPGADMRSTAARLVNVGSMYSAALQQHAAIIRSRPSQASPLRVSRTKRCDGMASRISCSLLCDVLLVKTVLISAKKYIPSHRAKLGHAFFRATRRALGAAGDRHRERRGGTARACGAGERCGAASIARASEVANLSILARARARSAGFDCRVMKVSTRVR